MSGSIIENRGEFSEVEWFGEVSRRNVTARQLAGGRAEEKAHTEPFLTQYTQ
jgi:hypothetical protein